MSATHRGITIGRPPSGLDGWVHQMMGAHARRGARLRRLLSDAERVQDQSESFRHHRDADLARVLLDSREQLRRCPADVSAVARQAMPAIAEAAARQLGLRPFTVQIAGALALIDGVLIEMATGEGKTLTAGLAAVVFGWTRRPCHILTVNDYLVERDANGMEPFYRSCGVRVGRVLGGGSPPERQHAYRCDVTYVTAKELLADVLRDQLKRQSEQNHVSLSLSFLSGARGARKGGSDAGLLRGLHTVMVDEADSILIDEAATPLIISTPRRNEFLCDAVREAVEFASALVVGQDFKRVERYQEVQMTDRGRTRLQESLAPRGGVWANPGRCEELVRIALQAREYYHRGYQYLIDDNRLVLIDEFTGRPMPKRSWRQGLHQAVEAKEGLPLSDPTETTARQSFQGFFRRVPHLCGMTGTARESSAELWNLYQTPVVSIPTNRPCRRTVLPTFVADNESVKWAAIVKEVRDHRQSGRPVLIGTRSVESSERIAELLQREAVPFELLNATRLAEEATIVAMAGQPGRVTIATNMAGRGTDILLGRGVAELGGLHVIVSEPHESSRVDRQLMGRAARQGDPGSARIFFSLEDELVRRFLPTLMVPGLGHLASSGVPGAMSVARLSMRRAQRRAEMLASRRRQSVLKMDNWLEESLAFSNA